MCSIHDDPTIARRKVAQQIAFYAAVRTYEPLLDFCGFAKQGNVIREAFTRGDFAAMFDAVTDDMIDVMGVAGTAPEVRAGLRRYEGVLDHIMLYPPSVGIEDHRVSQNLHDLIAYCSPEFVSDRGGTSPAAHCGYSVMSLTAADRAPVLKLLSCCRLDG